MEIRPEMTLNQVTDAFPAALAVLGNLGFDTCCGGAEQLGVAANRKGIKWESVIAALAPIVKGA